MARKILRFLARVDDVAEVLVFAIARQIFSRRGALVAGVALLGWAAVAWYTPAPVDQGLEPGALVPAVSGVNNAADLEDQLSDLDLDAAAKPVDITVDAIVGRHGDHTALVTFEGRSYRARPGTLLPQDGPPSFVITRVGCDSVEAYDWTARQSVTARYERPANNEIPEQTE